MVAEPETVGGGVIPEGGDWEHRVISRLLLAKADVAGRRPVGQMSYMGSRSQELIITTAGAGDAKALSELSVRTYTDAFAADMATEDLVAHLGRALSVQRWAEYLERDVVLVATMRGEWIAYLQYGPVDHPNVMEIRRVYVDAAWQHRGIGSMLIEYALNTPELCAAKSVEIDVWEANAGARRLYRRFGFVETDRRVPFQTSTGDVAGYDIVMERLVF